MKYYFTEYNKMQYYNASNKAREDVNKILQKKGYKFLPFYDNSKNKFLRTIEIVFFLKKLKNILKQGDELFLQYPYFKPKINMILMKKIVKIKEKNNIKITCLIHDLFSLRELTNTNGKEDEINLLNYFDNIICHNDKMKEFLKNSGLKSNILVLWPFDYLYNKNIIEHSYDKSNIKIIIAGNLSAHKSEFLYKLKESSRLIYNLYGIGYNNQNRTDIIYKGKFHPDELIDHLDGNYGLVWDGNDTKTCSGTFGEYLRYNNPHKFSLYIAAGIPLIVWKESALANYVIKNNLGLVVENLDDLDSILAKTSIDDYIKYKNSVLKVRDEIINGNHLISCLNQIDD